MKTMMILAALAAGFGGGGERSGQVPDEPPVIAVVGSPDQASVDTSQTFVADRAEVPDMAPSQVEVDRFTEPAPSRARIDTQPSGGRVSLGKVLALLGLLFPFLGAALSADRITDKKQGEEVAVPLAAAKVFRGGIVSINSAGFGKAAADVADEKVAGVSIETVDNSGGSAGDKRVKVQGGIFRLDVSGTFTQADVGKKCFIIDDHTVSVDTPGAGVVAGVIAEFISATEAWVKVDVMQRGVGIITADADATYGQPEADLVNEIKAALNEF